MNGHRRCSVNGLVEGKMGNETEMLAKSSDKHNSKQLIMMMVME